MSKNSKIVYFIIASIFFILFDIELSNKIVLNIESFPKNNFLDLIFIQNSGAAFNILANSKIFLILFSAAAISGIIYYLFKNIANVKTFSVFWAALLTAGIFCNMYERIIYGYVRDFFKLNFIDFPVFNISDIFINISVFVIVIIIVSNEINNRRTDRRNQN